LPILSIDFHEKRLGYNLMKGCIQNIPRLSGGKWYFTEIQKKAKWREVLKLQ